MRLFDAWPQKKQCEQVDKWLTPGKIVYLDCPFVEKPVRDKYLVVGSLEPRTLLLMINTNPPAFIQARPQLLRTQVALQVAQYAGVLTRDCYVSCQSVVNEFNLSDVRSQLLGDSSRMKGELLGPDRVRIGTAIKVSSDIVPRDRDLLLAGLGVA